MGVWEVAPVVAVAAGSTVVVTWGWGLWQRARTPSDGALITVDEVDCTTKKLTSGDLRRYYREGKVVVLRGVCAPIDELPPTAGDGIELFHPKKKLGAPHLALNVKFGKLEANIAKHVQEHTNASPLDELDYFQQSDADIEARNALYRKRELYGMVNVAQHVDPASQALLGWCIPKDLLKSWKNTVSYFWAGPSPGSLHYDEYDNVLFQLRGRKSVCVVPNRATTTLWGLPGWWQNLPNHSRFNNKFLSTDTLRRNPSLDPAGCVVVQLSAGDGLIIPAGVLHGPTGTVSSLSINTFLLNGPAPCGGEAWGVCQWLISRVDLAFLVYQVGGSLLGYASPHHSVQTLRL